MGDPISNHDDDDNEKTIISPAKRENETHPYVEGEMSLLSFYF